MQQPNVAGGSKGVEKESLRIDAKGYLSRKPHPVTLGSALTSPFITTDFSEALLEFVTPPYSSTWETLRSICDIHQFSYENIGDEMLWVASMPCRIPSDSDIPLARYGTSNVGQMKTIYRRGLGHRYGRQMQTIAGVHYNYSLPQDFWPAYQAQLGASGPLETFQSDQYMALIRNFRRFGWILLYLFGASPALCKSFADNSSRMKSIEDHTWYEPYGTSLRMSDLGYSNQNQSRINIDLNSVDNYVRDLAAAIRTPEAAYEEIGIKVDGEYRQLNANQLQIENEFYSPIRPKRVARSGERPTAALRRGGIEYVEIRSLDINVFDPCGINQNAMRFIEAFLVYCLLEQSPPFDDESLIEVKHNQAETARRGRDPDLQLQRDQTSVSLRVWAKDILANVGDVAELIDREEGDNYYAGAVRTMFELLADPEVTPSARILAELREAKCSFYEFGLKQAQNHRDYFRSITPLPAARYAELQDAVSDSLKKQSEIEESDCINLDDYLARYFAAD